MHAALQPQYRRPNEYFHMCKHAVIPRTNQRIMQYLLLAPLSEDTWWQFFKPHDQTAITAMDGDLMFLGRVYMLSRVW